MNLAPHGTLFRRRTQTRAPSWSSHNVGTGGCGRKKL